jgi:hypothetical protein
MHTNSLDPLSLQRTLLRLTTALGGAWTPALAVIDDATLKSQELRELADGSTLVVNTRLHAGSPGSAPGITMLSLLRNLSVAKPGTRIDDYRCTQLQTAHSVVVDFTDADAVLAAFDECCAVVDAQTHELRIALELAHV